MAASGVTFERRTWQAAIPAVSLGRVNVTPQAVRIGLTVHIVQRIRLVRRQHIQWWRGRTLTDNVLDTSDPEWKAGIDIISTPHLSVSTEGD